MTTKFTPANINAFVQAINDEIFPILQLTYEPDGDGHMFRLYLHTSPYVYSDTFCTTPEYATFIRGKCKEFFGRTPEFNNTHATFWFN